MHLLPAAALTFPDIDPALFTVDLGFFEFSLRWYALAYIGGLILGWRLMVLLMRRPRLWPGQQAPMTDEQPEELLTWMTLSVVLGGRLGYVIFYNPLFFLENPGAILRIWDGGMSFHGGFLGVILATILYARRNNMPLLQVSDAIALVTTPGLFFGRMANFINAELYGRVSDVPWAMRFPQINPATGERDFALLTEPRHPSQLYEAALEGVLLFAIMWLLAFRGRWLLRPGALTGLFFVGYGAARFFVEFFRQWDPQLSEMVARYGVTMGQALSLPMILIGLAFLSAAFRRRRAA
ncbi:MAG: prolipoprotein diacylglyceryl transferase [Pseudomonadota bacterium]